MDELKPCPFCGGEAEHRSVTDAEGSVFYETGCGNDSCCAWRAAQASTPQASISAWNARHEPRVVGAPDTRKLRDALAALVGSGDVTELRGMELAVRQMPAPEEDKAVTINAIHVLIATAPGAEVAHG